MQELVTQVNDADDKHIASVQKEQGDWKSELEIITDNV